MMKKILYAVMLLLGLSLLSSCNKENYNGSSGSILGEWQSTKEEYIFQGSVVISDNYDEERYVFYDNGNMIRYMDGESFTYPYVYDNKSGILSIAAMQWGITISSSAMVFTEKSEWYWDSDEEYKAIMYKGTQIYSDEDCSKYAYWAYHFWYYKDGAKIPLYCIEGERGELSTYDFYDEYKLYMARVK